MSETNADPIQRVGGDVLRLLDAVAGGRVVVFGSTPPEARDLDLLVPRARRSCLETALAGAGFSGRGGRWLRTGAARLDEVEIVDAESWRLPAAELEALFAEATPLDGCLNLVEPSPHHALLVLARRLAGCGPVPPKLRDLVRQAGCASSDAWAEAERRAPAWGVAEAVADLRRGAHPSPRARLLARVRLAPRPRPGGAVVALSGIDGAGKSTQARALRDALTAEGLDVVVEWIPLGNSRTQDRLAALLSRVLAGGTRGPQPAASGASGPAGAGAFAMHAWATFGTLLNALTLMRVSARHLACGRIVIFDRYRLDSLVHLRHAYGDDRRFPLETALLRLLTAPPLRAYFLDADPDVALVRKDLQYDAAQLRRLSTLYREEHARAGVVRLDAGRPPAELTAEIATDVLIALRR